MLFKLNRISKLTLAALIAALALPGFAKAEEVLKLSFFASPKDPTFSDVLLPWVEAINAEGKGIVRIDTFPGSALVRGPAAQAKAVSDGVADIAWVVPAYTPGRFPDNDVMELPNIIRDVRESSIAFRRLYDRGLLTGYEDFYVPLLATTHPYAIHTVKPVASMNDLKGMKLRAGGPVASAAVTALGAVPIGMPVPAIAENVSKGVLDGTGAEWNVMYAFKIIEVAKNHYMQRLGTVPLTVLMNKDKYNSLPEEARVIIDKHSGEALSRKFGDVHFAIQGKRLAL
jgi:TRAP-type C4-dicarboxylate transport system substrate-binding protein